jgi:hypothetical protein
MLPCCHAARRRAARRAPRSLGERDKHFFGRESGGERLRGGDLCQGPGQNRGVWVRRARGSVGCSRGRLRSKGAGRPASAAARARAPASGCARPAMPRRARCTSVRAPQRWERTPWASPTCARENSRDSLSARAWISLAASSRLMRTYVRTSGYLQAIRRARMRGGCGPTEGMCCLQLPPEFGDLLQQRLLPRVGVAHAASSILKRPGLSSLLYTPNARDARLV